MDPATAPPILAYDDLPSGSGITVGRGERAELVIDVPGEPYRLLVRRSLRTPRFWIFTALMALSQTGGMWSVAFYNGTRFASPQFWPIIAGPCIGMVGGLLVGLLIMSRRWERIEIERAKITWTRGGAARQRTQSVERDGVRDVTATAATVVLHVARDPAARRKSLRKIYLLPNRDPKELVWVARRMRQELALN